MADETDPPVVVAKVQHQIGNPCLLEAAEHLVEVVVETRCRNRYKTGNQPFYPDGVQGVENDRIPFCCCWG